MDELRRQIEAYTPFDEQEARDREMMLMAIDKMENTLTRENIFAHFTASSWIVNPGRTHVLMACHNIYKAWAWTGGHADGEADLLAVALREAREETGIERISPVIPGIYSLEIIPVFPHFRRESFVCGHLHMNATFLLCADDGQAIHAKPDENSGVKWMTLEVVEAIREEPYMASIYQKLNRKLQML